MEPVVEIADGQIKGITSTTQNGVKYYKFLGVPFAKPPINNLRFKAPEPAQPWTGIKDCTKESNPPCSMNLLLGGYSILGSEDCLYLNVYTKELSGSNSKPKPVMVYFYGGAFTTGLASEDLHGSKLLLDEDIVLVVPTYRVGIFGFLQVNDESLNIPGNAGLKDQNLALKWIQRNIKKFNGDPNNVTIFGISAGSASVEFHVISPASKGLFHKAIMQSGSVLNPWAWGRYQNGLELLETIDENITTEKEAIEILRALPEGQLALAATKLIDVITDSSIRRPYGPVIEHPNATAFLTEDPMDLLASGRYNHVPIIKGLTSNEGGTFEFIRERVGSDKMLPPTPDVGVLWTLGLKSDSNQYDELLTSIKNFYFKTDVVDSTTSQEFTGDTMFLAGIAESAKLIATTARMPLYFYVFSGENDHTKRMFKTLLGVSSPTDNVEGAIHGIELYYLFNSRQSMKLPEQPAKLSKILIKLWTNFAKTGIPSTETIKWEPFNDKVKKYLDISYEPVMEAKPFSKRWDFWQNVYSQTP